MKFVFSFFLIIFLGLRLLAADLSSSFTNLYSPNVTLNLEEQELIRRFDIYLVPGILSESFLQGDKRSFLNFSTLTKDYFSVQQEFLRAKYNLPTQRLSSSSRSVAEIKSNIHRALENSRRLKRKALFITHSLGGLALLEELLQNESSQRSVAGVVFLQSPFKGTPIADLYFENPYYLSSLIKPILPFLNTSEDTIDYLRITTRLHFMSAQKDKIARLLTKVPVLTVGSVVNSRTSLFKPAVDILGSGCVKAGFGLCLSRTLYRGPYEQSDGMVPFSSSLLETADYVRLEGVDHGETVVSIPFENYSKEVTTVVLLKLLLPKLKP